MKKLLLTAFVILSFLTAQAQTFKIGASVGLPAADAADISTLVLGIDAYYYFTDIDATVEIGATAGFRNFFGDEIGGFEIEDGQFLPLAGAARLKLFGVLTGGADIGYAVGINDGNDGGFYFRPVVGIDIADAIELNTSYESITNDGVTWGNINLGILFEF
jgi:hypothetical protein